MEKNKKAYTVFAWAALCLLAFTFIFPLYWIVTGSFKLQTATVKTRRAFGCGTVCSRPPWPRC